MTHREHLAQLELEARQAENRRGAVAAYGDTSTEAYRQLVREAEAASNSYYEALRRTA